MKTNLVRCGIFWVTFLGFVPLCFSQSAEKFELIGDGYKDDLNWPMAEAYYADAFLRDSTRFELTFKLALSSWHNHSDDQAIRLFEKVVKKDQGKIHPESYFYLGNLKMRNGLYPSAQQYWKKYKQKIKSKGEIYPELLEVEHGLKCIEWALKQLPVDSIQWKELPFNGSLSEGQAYWLKDSIYFQKWTGTDWQMWKCHNKGKDVHPFIFQQGNSKVIHPVQWNKGWIGVEEKKSGSQLVMSSSGKEWQPIDNLISKEGRNSMPAIGYWDGYTYLIFASDRSGGFGGMDIWFSRWNGNQWERPFNAGDVINTVWDEIEPSCFEGHLFFSSKGHLGFGEFDVFQSSGKPGGWAIPTNMGLPTNSPRNDIGLSKTVKPNGQLWVMSSAKKGSGCCLDMYTYEWTKSPDEKQQKDSIPVEIIRLESWLPLPLYFHNDEPQPKSWDKTTTWTYTNCYQSYLQQKTNYLNALGSSDEWEQFEETQLTWRYEQWQKSMNIIESRMKAGDSLTIVVRGFASPLADGKYNQFLTERRIDALRNDLLHWNDGSLKPFLDNQLRIQARPFGESKSAKISDDLYDQRSSIYSQNARNERRIEIEAIEWHSSKGQLKRLGKAE